jgi:2-polyprenyl-3-methyl-5-hydroxy-6-metoxy-1,4-benzoquinol methylase
VDQHSEALAFFDATASEWQAKASGQIVAYPVIEMRHKAAHAILGKMPNARDFLDVGCGTGQLAIEVAARGLNSTGIDFAPEMIRQCQQNAAGSAAKFVVSSAQDYAAPAKSIDLISAMGFIEYITLADLDRFLERSRLMLRPGGRIALGSRNRLFNVVTMNAFTEMERQAGTLDRLVQECIAIGTAADQSAMIAALSPLSSEMTQVEKHPFTGIGVSTRFQFSPGDLMARVRKHGFEPVTLYPVHYHGIPTALVPEVMTMHTAIASSVEKIGYPNHRLLPYSSSYVMDARIPG